MPLIHWPSIIKYTGEDELMFVASEEEWSIDADLHAFAYEAEDVLIDSKGEVFGFAYIKNSAKPQSKGQFLAQDLMTELVRKHASQLGNCCISKISFTSIQAAVAAVGDMQD